MLKQLTWKECAALRAGDTLRVVEAIDLFPQCVVPVGTTAIVTTNDLNEINAVISLLPDNASIRSALALWYGEIVMAPPTNSRPDYFGQHWDDISPFVKTN